MSDGAPLLQVRGVHKRYAAPVLADVDIDLMPGEVHALVGANGAGKTTLARIVCGLTAPDAGTMTLDGRAYAPRTKAEAERVGVQVVMQELNLVGTLTVAENLFLGRLPRRLGLVDAARLRRMAAEALAAVGLEALDPETPVARLGVGQQQLVEIAAALARPCRVLVLDEPTAALTDPEIALLFRHVRRLQAEGVGVVYVSHRMDEIRRIADRVTVLRDGRVVETAPTRDLPLDRIVRLMVGRATVDAYDFGAREIGPVVLRVEGLRRGGAVRGVSFEVRRGEVLGLAGLVGSGRTALLRALFGADPPDAGRVFVDGRPVALRTPRDAVRAGIGMIPEDRKQHGLLLAQPVRFNATLARLAAVTKPRGWIAPAREREVAERVARQVAVHAAGVEQPVAELSGGNQQKVVLARWLLRDPEVLLLDEPTRGVDVAAKATVYRLLGELAVRGKALVVVSGELRELMAVCDRIAVMSAGRLVATFVRGAWAEDAIMAAALSGYLDRDDSGGEKEGVPAEVGIQTLSRPSLDPRFRGDDT
jgi:ribose transport system ATP-binding protein